MRLPHSLLDLTQPARAGLKPHASLSPEQLRGLLEVATGVSVADRESAIVVGSFS
jgi:hypothetical protein